MNIDYKQIGQHIKQIRKSKKMTQENLAEQLDVSVGYISQIERGATKISLDLLAAVATVLGCKIAYFLDGVSVGQEIYLETALQTKIRTLSPQKKKLLFQIAELLSHTEDMA